METIGRYALFDELAAGGMATVHLGRLLGPVGFSRTVAIKRLHSQFSKDPEFVASFLDEARIAARIRHPNVVSTLDVVATSGELFLVMEYVQGESLSSLVKLAQNEGKALPVAVSATIVSNALTGLHAAHEARDEAGEPLQIIHRDVSPQNFLVGTDGVTRVLDFGVAKAAGRAAQTREGTLKGKLAYMPPEQLTSAPIDRRVDVYAAGIVLWEALTGKRCFRGDNEFATMALVCNGLTSLPSEHNPEVPPVLDQIVAKACSLDPDQRFPTAEAFAQALEEAISIASTRQVSKLVERLASRSLASKEAKVKEVERSSSNSIVLPSLDEIPAGLSRRNADLDTAILPAGPPSSASPASASPVSASPVSAGVLSVQNIEPPTPQPGRGPWLTVAGVASVVLLAGVSFLVGSRQRTEPAAPVAPALVASPATTTSPSAAPSAAPVASAPAAVVVSAAPSATAPTSAEPPPAASSKGTFTVVKAKAPPPATTAPPPMVFDSRR